MGLTIYNLAKDNVINSFVGIGQANYDYTLEKICPLINKFEEQRKLLDNRFYDRLERDILKGCLMPPITIAFVDEIINLNNAEEFTIYINDNISKGFVLDGIQRLNTLLRASKKEEFEKGKEIFFNIIIADNKDKLLYRMITLNNGSKGMTPRHQIEILTQELFDFSSLQHKIQTEKEKSTNPIKEAFSLADISKGYIAFLTSNVHNENSKIIDEKMDQILIGRILDTNINSYEIQFDDIVHYVDRVSINEKNRVWFQLANNFIGFCVGFRKSHRYILNLEADFLAQMFENFEIAFKAMKTSKINIGKYRRELSKYFIENAEQLFKEDAEFLTERFFEQTVTE
ncbi:hypothetical protein [Emticicia sp. TH156]|uniref:hypothetical protein n=1 Tax=Emticicia sp. TH156 TaxID=2067454 RepID=UPI001C1F3FC6|nr:hypothetical protein [Emticicia sp. TH156]